MVGCLFGYFFVENKVIFFVFFNFGMVLRELYFSIFVIRIKGFVIKYIIEIIKR